MPLTDQDLAAPNKDHAHDQQRMAQHSDIFDFDPDAGDLEAIATLDQNASSFFDHRVPAMVKWLGEWKLGLSFPGDVPASARGEKERVEWEKRR
ncbi:hypothetical protein [Sphingomonas sp. 1P08PE]|uniref:hypothetical protein n=1 Tax=Sphingomonas sp. 1P08PE TaxID=554122 RepID=UPI0039A2F0C6